jgi:hypothetical protein
MPRYYFDVYDGEKTTADDTGVELTDDHQAQQEAIRTLPAVAKDALPDGTQRDFVIEVRNAARRPILRAKLALTVQTILDS